MDFQTWAGGTLVIFTLVIFSPILVPIILTTVIVELERVRGCLVEIHAWLTKTRAWLAAKIESQERRLVELEGEIKATFNI